MTEAQKCLYHIAENMRMDKSISKEGYEYFQQAIKALEQEPRWIPVSKRLPKDGGDYFVTTIFDVGGKEPVREVRKNFFCVLSKKWLYENDIVIAWMPLPKPYEAESEGEYV